MQLENVQNQSKYDQNRPKDLENQANGPINIQKVHMANIHQDGHSIRNIQVVSSNRVHSTPLCEANKCRIFKPFFFVYQIKGV